jgi:uncharacterized membrane protein
MRSTRDSIGVAGELARRFCTRTRTASTLAGYTSNRLSMKWLKRILQGHWLGHPLHPALVHLPAGLWPAALVFDILSFTQVAGPATVFAGFACIAAGLFGALLAAPTGLADWLDIKPDKPARKLGVYHLVLNLIVTALFAVNLLLRWHDFRTAERPSVAQLVLSVVGVAILAVSGYLGGRMAYDQGIGVARMSKEKWRRIAEAGHANLPPAKAKGG